MPSSEIMSRFRAGKLHSGRGGKIVRKRSQARAILLSYLEREGKIPSRKKKHHKKHSGRKTATKR